MSATSCSKSIHGHGADGAAWRYLHGQLISSEGDIKQDRFTLVAEPFGPVECSTRPTERQDWHPRQGMLLEYRSVWSFSEGWDKG